MYDTPAERQSIRDLLATLYRAISGPAGAPRKWDDLRACYTPEARITPFHVDDEGNVRYEVLTPETYIASREPLFAINAFFEEEVGHEATIEGRLAHVYSRYEARRAPGEPPFTSGVNSVQLVREREGWKVVAMAWQFTGAKPKGWREG